MPIYEYACDACDHSFEMIQRIDSPPPAECPECGDTHVRKLVSCTSFVLKGSGWYKDGYGLQKSGSSGASPAPAVATPAEVSVAKAAAK